MTDIDIDAADVVHRAACLLHRRFDIFADLSRLRFNVADTGYAAVCATSGHA